MTHPDLLTSLILLLWLLGFIHLWDETAPKQAPSAPAHTLQIGGHAVPMNSGYE